MMHVILQTDREEIRGAVEEHAVEEQKEELLAWVDSCSEEDIGHIARKLGDILMEGGDYWEGMPDAVKRAMPSPAYR